MTRWLPCPEYFYTVLWAVGQLTAPICPGSRIRDPFFFFFKVSGTLFYFIYLFIYFWLCWVFVSVRGFSLVVASGGHSSSRCAGLSLSRPLLLRSTGSRCAGSVVVAHRLSCSAACGILPDQGLNPCPLHWQADSQPLRHQGSPQRPILSLNSTVTAQWPSAKMDETFPT